MMSKQATWTLIGTAAYILATIEFVMVFCS